MRGRHESPLLQMENPFSWIAGPFPFMFQGPDPASRRQCETFLVPRFQEDAWMSGPAQPFDVQPVQGATSFLLQMGAYRGRPACILQQSRDQLGQ